MDVSWLRARLDEEEDKRLSPYAARSTEAFREHDEERALCGHRQWFSLDADRILHSLSYTRYIDKTQVFSLIPNDHITHRVLHVQLVSKIARTIGRLLRLNEDLIEAIALGHDIGHPPFGHDGERHLFKLCREHGAPPFIHGVQGVHFLRRVEKKGRGINLSCQVLDGILCHDGEAHLKSIMPLRGKDFDAIDKEIAQKFLNPESQLRPMTLEGCVVRMADVISYIGRDIEDAIRINLIKRDMVPGRCRAILGETNGTIVYRLVEDLVSNSLGRDEISFSADMAESLLELKEFNYRYIYKNEKIKTESGKIERLYGILFERFLSDLASERRDSVIFADYLDGMDPSYREAFSPPEIVRDFIAGMTDAYFLRMGRDILIPRSFPVKF